MTAPGGNSGVFRARKIYRSIIDSVNDVVLIIDPKLMSIMDANSCATDLYGYSHEELVGMEISTLTHDTPDYSQLLRGNKSPPSETAHFSKSGEKIELLISSSVIDYWGRKAVLSVNRDIRERKRMETALRRSEKRFRSIIGNSSDIIALISEQGTMQFVSPQTERVLGFHSSDLLGHNVFEFVHLEDLGRAVAEFSQTVQQKGEGVPSMLRVRDATGTWIPFEIIARNYLDDPDIAAVIFTARDLRFRKETEEAIRRANADLDKRIEERIMEMAKANAALRIENQERRYAENRLKDSLSLLEATLESTADGILVVSATGQVTSYNQKFIEMWRIPSYALVNMRDEEMLAVAADVDDPEMFLQNIRDLYARPNATSFDIVTFKDGRVFERYSQPQHVGDRIVGRVWSFRDVTHTKRMEEDLHQSQKMEAVGRLAGGIAHDFNNLLMLISGHTTQILEATAVPEGLRMHGEEIVQATKRAASLTRQLLAFSRKQPLARTIVDLNQLIPEMERMLKTLLADDMRVEFHLSTQPITVYADPSQIDLALMNLVINARDAMPGGGVLSITTREETVVGAVPKSGAKSASVNYALLEISDTGHGMTPEVQARIFEPFFTTKELGKGTGLGLSTVYGIVQQNGGHITVDSEPNRGTTFRIYLPKALGTPEAVPVHITAAIPRTAHETILLVEDEDGIRAMMRVYLEGLGYKVLEAPNGPEAIQLADQYPRRIDLLVTDIVMPGMRGSIMAATIRKRRKDIKILFISGYADTKQLDSYIPVLEKPFTFPELGELVRSILDTPKSQIDEISEDKAA